MLGRNAPVGEVIIAGVVREQVISHRLAESVQLHAHADFVAIRQPFAHLLVNLIRFYELKRERIVKACATMLDDEYLTITRQRLNHQFLGVNKRQLAIGGAISTFGPAFERIFYGLVADLV